MACLGIKGTPVLATGTKQLIFLIKLKGVVFLMFAKLQNAYLSWENQLREKDSIIQTHIIYAKDIIWRKH